MRITWDEPKRLRNLAKHGMDFAALTVEFFEGSTVYPAKSGRFLAIGELGGELGGERGGEIVVTVVFRPLGSEAVAVISMRRAGKTERSRIDD